MRKPNKLLFTLSPRKYGGVFCLHTSEQGFFEMMCNKLRVLVTNRMKGGGHDLRSMSPSNAAHVLFDQHGDEVYRYIRFTIGNKTEAEDILQEVFLRVVQSWDRFNHRSSPKTWLWSIVNNCIREYMRKAKRLRDTVPYDDTEQPASAADILFSLDLEASLRCLSTEQRQVFVERIIHEKSSKEAAKTLGWSDAKVRTTLHRATNKIQAWFHERGDKSGSS